MFSELLSVHWKLKFAFGWVQSSFHFLSFHFVSSQVPPNPRTVIVKEMANPSDLSLLLLYFYMFRKHISWGMRQTVQRFLAELCVCQDGVDPPVFLGRQFSPQALICLQPPSIKPFKQICTFRGPAGEARAMKHPLPNNQTLVSRVEWDSFSQEKYMFACWHGPNDLKKKCRKPVLPSSLKGTLALCSRSAFVERLLSKSLEFLMVYMSL